MRTGRRACAATAVAVATAGMYWVFLSPYSQLFGRYPWRGDEGDRVVALTFDDGPNEPYTSQIAQVLEDRGVRATFFQVGWCVQRSPATTAALAAAGHVIGNHALSHRFRAYLRCGALAAEIEQTQQILGQVLGREPRLVRTPWLWRQPAILSMLARRGLTPVSGLFCHALEVVQVNAARIAARAIAKAGPGVIIIFHDGYNARGGVRAATVEAVRLTIDGLRDRGYRFVTVDQLLGVPAYRPPQHPPFDLTNPTPADGPDAERAPRTDEGRVRSTYAAGARGVIAGDRTRSTPHSIHPAMIGRRAGVRASSGPRRSAPGALAAMVIRPVRIGYPTFMSNGSSARQNPRATPRTAPVQLSPVAGHAARSMSRNKEIR